MDFFAKLPARLRRALWTWIALAPLAAVLPVRDAVGLLAHPGFWCGLLPLLALTPTLARWRPARPQHPRRRSVGAQARRRNRLFRSERTRLAA